MRSEIQRRDLEHVQRPASHSYRLKLRSDRVWHCFPAVSQFFEKYLSPDEGYWTPNTSSLVEAVRAARSRPQVRVGT